MKKLTVSALLTGAILVGAGTLMSFYNASPALSKKDEETKKKYEVIHYENGKLTVIDTTISKDSKYSVEDFLADRNIQPQKLEIIEIDNMTAHKEEPIVVKRAFKKEQSTTHKDEHQEENISIFYEIDENGNETVKKIVNGEEATLSPEEIEEIKSFSPEDTNGENEIIIDVDIQELENLEGEIKEIIKSIDVEIQDFEGLNIDSLLQTIELNEEALMNGENNVIVKTIKSDDTEGHDQQVVIATKKEFEWNDEDGHNHIKVSSTGEDENMTIVLVSEVSDNKPSKKSSMIKLPAIDFTIYPNPNNGDFTLNFIQEEESATTISILDMNGKVVYSEDLGQFKGEYRNTIDLKAFGKGVYMINIVADNAQSTGRVIIQ